jgi:hypothetical protein
MVIINDEKIYGREVLYDTQTKYICKNKNFCFKPGDFIIKINGISLNNNCKIYNYDFGCEFNFDSHVMLKCYENINNSCNFTILRDKQVNTSRCDTNDIETIEVELTAKNSNLLYGVNIFNNHKYVSFCGFVFVELSEELLHTMIHIIGVPIYGNIIMQPKKTTGNRKFVVVVDIDKNIVPVKYLEYFLKIGDKITPLVSTSNGNYFLILEKVGKKSITNIGSLAELICNKNNFKNKLTFVYEDTNNNRFIEIKMDTREFQIT